MKAAAKTKRQRISGKARGNGARKVKQKANAEAKAKRRTSK
jgi:hypothetical protein